MTGYFAGRLLPNPAYYRYHGTRRLLRGQDVLALICNIMHEDEYRLQRCSGMQTIADIGANVGIFALHAVALFPKAEIHCYEPDPRNISDLSFNLSGLSPRIFQEAVGQSHGMSWLHLDDDRTASGLASGDPSIGNSVEVATVDLRVVAERFPNGTCDLLKLDCEGSEYDILVQPEIRRFGRIAGELHVTANKHPQDGLDLLRDHGFRLVEFRSFVDGKAIFIADREDL